MGINNQRAMRKEVLKRSVTADDVGDKHLTQQGWRVTTSSQDSPAETKQEEYNNAERTIIEKRLTEEWIKSKGRLSYSGWLMNTLMSERSRHEKELKEMFCKGCVQRYLLTNRIQKKGVKECSETCEIKCSNFKHVFGGEKNTNKEV